MLSSAACEFFCPSQGKGAKLGTCSGPSLLEASLALWPCWVHLEMRNAPVSYAKSHSSHPRPRAGPNAPRGPGRRGEAQSTAGAAAAGTLGRGIKSSAPCRRRRSSHGAVEGPASPPPPGKPVTLKPLCRGGGGDTHLRGKRGTGWRAALGHTVRRPTRHSKLPPPQTASGFRAAPSAGSRRPL